LANELVLRTNSSDERRSVSDGRAKTPAETGANYILYGWNSQVFRQLPCHKLDDSSETLRLERREEIWLAGFIIKFWNGRAPLLLSTFGGAILVVAIVRLVNFCFSAIEDWGSAFFSPSLFLIVHTGSFYLVLVSLSIFWSVGVWRAAGRSAHDQRIWAILAKIGVALVVFVIAAGIWTRVIPIVSDAISEMRGDPGFGPRGVLVHEDGSEVEVYGFLSNSVANDLAAALGSHKNIRVVRLRSIGGRIDAASHIQEIILSRHLDTFVSDKCISACIIAFLAGHQRKISPEAQLGFHAAMLGNEMAQEQTDKIKREAIVRGISYGFVQKAYASKEIWYPSLAELRSAGVVTGVVETRD
jgi:hypothetical protein